MFDSDVLKTESSYINIMIVQIRIWLDLYFLLSISTVLYKKDM